MHPMYMPSAAVVRDELVREYSDTEMPFSRRQLQRKIRHLSSVEQLEELLPYAHTLSWYRPGRRIEVSDKMQCCSYVLSEKPGRGFDVGFRPALSPGAMLRRGVFEGKYLNDCVLELPREWYADALSRLSPGAANSRLNEFGVKSRQSLSAWRKKGWVPVVRADRDVRGWFQWYCRYWLGRREPEIDAIQIRRWRAFSRHRGQILASYRRGARPRSRSAKRKHRPRQRQALLQWAYNPYV